MRGFHQPVDHQRSQGTLPGCLDPGSRGDTRASPLLPSAHWAPAGASAGCAPFQGLCAPGRLPPGPSAAAALALHGTQGLAGGPGKPVQLAATPPALVARQGLPAFPRPASVRPSSAAVLFPPLCPTGQTGFSAPGRSLSPPPGSGRGRARLGDQAGAGAGGGPRRLPSLDPSPGRRGAGQPGLGLAYVARL